MKKRTNTAVMMMMEMRMCTYMCMFCRAYHSDVLSISEIDPCIA